VEKRDSVFVSHLAAAFSGKWPILTYSIDYRCDAESGRPDRGRTICYSIGIPQWKIFKGDIAPWNSSYPYPRKKVISKYDR